MKEQGKKILVGGLITILVGGLIVFGVYLYSSIKHEDYYLDETIKDVADNIEEDNTIEEFIIEEEQLEEKEDTIEQIAEEVKQEEKVDAPIVNNEAKVTQNKTTQVNTSNDNQNANTQSEVKVQVKQEETKTTATPTAVQKTKKEEPKPVETPKQEEQKQDVHTYKYNSAIVEKIRQDIMNNESEYMKQYGYNIVVDESIVTQTNQFTYTGNRVKDMIVYKFGTIRIYARDYYLNGNYMYTECYII